MTDITPKNLIALGYREYPGTLENRFFQKCFKDADNNKKYFVAFREWPRPGEDKPAFDIQLCCETDSGGYLWGVFREESIAAAEARAALLWEAAGGVFYEKIG